MAVKQANNSDSRVAANAFFLLTALMEDEAAREAALAAKPALLSSVYAALARPSPSCVAAAAGGLPGCGLVQAGVGGWGGTSLSKVTSRSTHSMRSPKPAVAARMPCDRRAARAGGGSRHSCPSDEAHGGCLEPGSAAFGNAVRAASANQPHDGAKEHIAAPMPVYSGDSGRSRRGRVHLPARRAGILVGWMHGPEVAAGWHSRRLQATLPLEGGRNANADAAAVLEAVCTGAVAVVAPADAKGKGAFCGVSWGWWSRRCH